MPLVSASSEVRRNLIGNPVGGTPVSGWSLQVRWYGSGGAGTTTPLVAGPVTLPDGTVAPSFMRKTWTASGGSTNDVGFALYNATRVSVTAGTAYTIQLHWRRSWGGALDVCSWRLMFFNAASGGAQVGSTVMGPTITPPAVNTWQRDSITFTPPAGATHAEPVFYIRAADGLIPVGGTLDATAACAEAWPALRRPFWGGYSPDLALFSKWLGPVNASASGLMTPEVHETDVDLTLDLATTAAAAKAVSTDARMLLDLATTAAAAKAVSTDARMLLDLAISAEAYRWRNLTVWPRPVRMQLHRQAREWFSIPAPRVSTSSGTHVAMPPGAWEASFDNGQTWHPAVPDPDIPASPAWLLAGPGFPGSGDPSAPHPKQVRIAKTAAVLIRLINTLETNIRIAGLVAVV